MAATTPPSVRSWLTRTEGSALLATAAASIALVGAALIGWGAAAGTSALLGTVDVLVFFGLGAGVQARALRRADWSSGAIVLLAYGARIGLLTAVALWLARTSWLASPMWFAGGMMVATMAWPVGLLAGHITGRWLIYGRPYVQEVPA